MSALQFDLFGNLSVPAKKVPVKAHERTIRPFTDSVRPKRKRTVRAARAERDRILDALGQNHADYLSGLRAIARAIAQRCGEVSVDSVREDMERTGYPFPEQIGADNRILGPLFRHRDFIAVRQEPTTRSQWAARVGKARSNVTVYRLRES